jgi:uncharacterized membrane protein
LGKKKKKKPVVQEMNHPNWPVAVLAGAGMALTSYLVVTSLLGHPPAYCSEGSSCEIVQRSRWGTFLGLPTAFWGFLTYTVLLSVSIWMRDAASHWKSVWTVSLLGLSYSVYLMAISVIVIEAACFYCIISFTIMAVIFVVATFQRPKEMPKFRFAPFAGKTAIIALVIVGGMHLHYSGVVNPKAGPEDPFLKGLAEHLTEKHALFFGAYW